MGQFKQRKKRGWKGGGGVIHSIKNMVKHTHPKAADLHGLFLGTALHVFLLRQTLPHYQEIMYTCRRLHSHYLFPSMILHIRNLLDGKQEQEYVFLLCNFCFITNDS